MKKRLYAILSLAFLTLSYLAVRYPLLGLHGMKQWPFALFIFGAALIAVFGIGMKRKLLPVLTSAGYIAGFFAGYLFQYDYGIGLNSFWIIWTSVFLVFILAGAAAELFTKKK